MPQYGGGAFQRAESYYQDPTEYREMMRGAGAEKATYLSAMDQFYAELEEEKRQFGEKLGFERERLAFEEESQEEEYQLSLKQQAAQESQFGEQLAWQREQMKFEAGEAEERQRYPYEWAEQKDITAQLEEWEPRLTARQTPASRRFVAEKVRGLRGRVQPLGGSQKPASILARMGIS